MAKTQPSATAAWVTQAKETQDSQVQSITHPPILLEEEKLVPSEYFSSLPSLFFKPVNFLMIIACIDKFA